LSAGTLINNNVEMILQHTHIGEIEKIMGNPFELRFKLLEMAPGYMQEQSYKSDNLNQQAWELAQEQGTATVELLKTLQPATYSVADIKAKAEELYEFVATKK